MEDLVSLPRRAAVRRLLLAAAVGLLTFCVYLPALSNRFVNWDDDAYVYSNPYIRHIDAAFFKRAFFSFHRESGNWHPLTTISHAMDYALWGLDPRGHHLTSILLHAVNASLVAVVAALLIESARRRRPGLMEEVPVLVAAGITGLLFGLHPVHVESVAWVSERKDVLCAMFFLSGIMSYLRYAEGRAERPHEARHELRWYSATLAFFVLALMSKPMAVSFPLVLLILDWYPLERLDRAGLRRALLEKVPFAVLGAVSAVITAAAQKAGGTLVGGDVLSFSTRVLVAFRSFVMYLVKMAVPKTLLPMYEHPQAVTASSPDILLSIAFTAALFLFCLWSVRRRKVWAALFAYYAVTLLPVLGVIQVGAQAMADRYSYLPSLSPFLAAGLGITALYSWVRRSSRGRALYVSASALCLILLTLLSYKTVLQTRIWRDGGTLWNHQVRHAPEGYIGYHQRANYFNEVGEYARAVEDHTSAMGRTRRTGALYYSHFYRAIAFVNMGRFADAVADLNEAKRLDPGKWQAYAGLANIYLLTGRCNEALPYLDQAIARMSDGGSTDVYYQRGICLGKAGDHAASLDAFNEAIRRSSLPVSAYFEGRSSAYEHLGRMHEAGQDRRAAARIALGEAP